MKLILITAIISIYINAPTQINLPFNQKITEEKKINGIIPEKITIQAVRGTIYIDEEITEIKINSNKEQQLFKITQININKNDLYKFNCINTKTNISFIIKLNLIQNKIIITQEQNKPRKKIIQKTIYPIISL